VIIDKLNNSEFSFDLDTRNLEKIEMDLQPESRSAINLMVP
jgi:hypothetical protein